MRITSKGQVTIPLAIREAAGLLPHTEVDFVYEDGEVKIRRTKVNLGESRGERLIRLLRGSGTANHELTTDEILNWSRSELPAAKRRRSRK
jgi:AbrB family looped-hinge helix DNA binding protein